MDEAKETLREAADRILARLERDQLSARMIIDSLLRSGIARLDGAHVLISVKPRSEEEHAALVRWDERQRNDAANDTG